MFPGRAAGQRARHLRGVAKALSGIALEAADDQLFPGRIEIGEDGARRGHRLVQAARDLSVRVVERALSVSISYITIRGRTRRPPGVGSPPRICSGAM
jgi:hypothetical protein